MPAAVPIALVASAAIAGGATVYASNKASEAAKAGIRNPSKEAEQMFSGQTLFAPQQYSQYAQYAPLYAQTDAALANQYMGNNVAMAGNYMPQIDALNAQSSDAFRANEIAGVDQYGQRVADQYRALNPELYSSLGAMSAAANQPLGTAGGAQASQLESMLGAQAQQQLGLGTQLSAAEQRDATQAARNAGAARGLYDSNGTIGAEILNNYSLAQQRLQQRQQFAGDTAQLLRSGQQQDAGLAQQQFGNLSAATNAWQQNRFDPYAGILGQQSANQMNIGGMLDYTQNTMAYNQNATREMFNPFNSYGGAVGASNSAANMGMAGIYGNMMGNQLNNFTGSLQSLGDYYGGYYGGK